MADIFQDAHKAAQRKTEAEEAGKEILARDARIAQSAAKRVKKPEPGYRYSGPFYK